LNQIGVKFCAFLDAGVPDSVGRVLTAFGHSPIYHRDALSDRPPDTVVATTALANDAILVAIDKDMKQIAQRYGMTPRNTRFERLSLIQICCDEVLASKRIEHAMSFLEHEWAFKLEKSARRMWVEIGPHNLKTNR
jgi:predicted nuclease of predicted toxin-antitoxin system